LKVGGARPTHLQGKSPGNEVELYVAKLKSVRSTTESTDIQFENLDELTILYRFVRPIL